MSMHTFYPCESRVCAIKILSYENRNPRGVLQNLNLESDIAFNSLTELLLLMERLFDELGAPQRTMKPRGKPEAPKAVRVRGDGAPMATFLVEVLFRQNASWQGNIVWQDKREQTQFRSALELIGIMDEILCPGENRT